MAWNVKGSYFETCSCELMCPCNLSFDHGATYDYCRVTLVFNVRQGEVEGTDVGGHPVAMIADTPKVMTEGNWRVGLFVDDKASDEQFEKLVGVFSGQLGGPMGAGLSPAFAAARARLGLVVVLFGLAGIGWWWSADQMRGMDQGPWSGLGTAGWFLGVWIVMMAAMMFPSVAPTVALYSRMTRTRSPRLPLLFSAGYLLTWTLAGLLALAVG